MEAWRQISVEIKDLSAIFKNFLANNFKTNNYFYLFLIILGIRLLFVLIDPLVTSDLLRNIFYGQNFWKFGLKVYDYTPLDMDTNYNILDPLSGELSWEKNMYDYPIIHLWFFAIIALIPFPVIISKVIFTFFDLINFFMIRSKNQHGNLSWLYLIVSSVFTSLEGQVVSITIFLFLISLYFYSSSNKKLAYFFSAIGFQWKIIEIILFPYYVIKDLSEFDRKGNLQIQLLELGLCLISFLFPFLILTIIPLMFSRYLLNSQFISGFVYDVESWNVLYFPNFLLSGLTLALTTIYILIIWYKRRSEWKKGLDYIPVLELGFFFLFIYKFAMPWAWLYFLPVFMTIPENKEFRRKNIFYLLLLTFSFGALDFFNLTIGFSGLSDLINHLIKRIFLFLVVI